MSASRVGAYCIRPTKRHQRWRKISCSRPLRGRLWGVCDTPLQPGTCEGSKNGSVFATVGDVWWAYSIRPYNRVCAILQNTDAIPQLGTCGPSKNCPVFVPFEPAVWSVFNTLLRLGMCDSSKYRCNSSTRYVLPFKKLSRFRSLRGRPWGVCDTPHRPGTCDSSKY